MRARGAHVAFVLSCEHAGHRVPREYVPLFDGAREVVESHRGWDAGALRLARLFARRVECPLLATHWSRLLVDSNRSPSNPRIWSRFTRELPRAERERILARYWRPHREEVEAAVAGAIGRGGRVVHVAVHSFTPVIEGEARNADVGLLFDSRRPREGELARRWQACLAERAPWLRVRLNYPYRGCTDGLATWLRRRHPAARYCGLELEVSQARAAAPGWRSVGEALAASLAAALPFEAHLTPRPPPRCGGSARRSPPPRAR